MTTKKTATKKAKAPVQTDIEPEHEKPVKSDNAKMVDVATRHLDSQSPSNDPETSLMRVFINLINKGFDEREATAYIMSKAREFGLVK